MHRITKDIQAKTDMLVPFTIKKGTKAVEARSVGVGNFFWAEPTAPDISTDHPDIQEIVDYCLNCGVLVDGKYVEEA